MNDFEIKPEQCRITLTQEQVEQLRVEIKRTGFQVKEIFEKLNPKPQGLSSGMIHSWISRRVSARLDHFLVVYETLKSLPDMKIDQRKEPRNERIKLFAEQIDQLKSLIRKTDTPMTCFFHQNKERLPDGLSYAMASTWLSGRVKTARKDHYDFIISGYEKLPTASPEKKSGRDYRMNQGVKEIRLTSKIINEFYRLQDKSGLRPRQLLSKQKDVPEELDYLQVYKWMTKKVEWVAEVNLDYILRIWAKEITVRGRKKNASHSKRKNVSNSKLIKF